jgi:CRISPR/Cas system-associated exonuclease Cas4 (RecB family)
MKLTYSKYDTYLKCPRKYKYETDGIKPITIDSKYFALYGILIQKFFQDYTNVYVNGKVPLTTNAIRSTLKKMWDNILYRNYVNWKDPWVKQTADEIYEEAYKDILENIKAFPLFKECKSEVNIEIKLKKSGDILNGRLDFIRQCPDGSVEILDGKSTSHLDRVDQDQLLFYALLYFLRNSKLPKRLGFLFYRYRTIQYIDFNADIFIKFKNKLALAKEAIKKDKEFVPKVKLSKVCLWCAYKLECEPYQTKKEASRIKRSKLHSETDGGIISLGADED